MNSGSVRLTPPRDIHQHEDPPEGSGGFEMPGSPDDPVSDRPETPGAGRLWRENGRLMYRPAVGGEASPARVTWARPLSGRGGPASILVAGKKRELAYLPSLEVLPEESRRVALEELSNGMVLPRILEIFEVKARHGNYYWDVRTDMGRRTFLVVSPENNSMRPRPDVLVVKDASGNCYEINPVSGLSKSSTRELDRAL